MHRRWQKTMAPDEQTGLLDPLVIYDEEMGEPTGAASPRRRKNYDSNSSPGNHNHHDDTTPTASNVRHARNLRRHKKDVRYNGDNHLSVLFQMHGSVWPNVAPFCLATMLWTYGLLWLRRKEVLDLTIQNNTGHNFMSLLVSFLVVTRATITYNRFMEARLHLADLFRASREVVQYTCLLTCQRETGPAARQWRQDVAYRMIVALRVAIAAVEFRSHGVNAWETIEADDDDDIDDKDDSNNMQPGEAPRVIRRPNLVRRQTTLSTLGEGDDAEHADLEHGQPQQRQRRSTPHHHHLLEQLRHGPRSLMDENLRAPTIWIYNVRETILEHRNNNASSNDVCTIFPHHPPHVNEDLRWMALTSDWMTAFHGLKMLLTTPFPFPFVQMTRTFLFVWVFSLPMVLIPDNDNTVEILLLMLFITYCFIGIEYVSMELDDPYGNDPNDFPGKRWAELCYEDIYVCIYQTDGYASAMALRSRVKERLVRGAALDNFHEDMQDDQMNFSGTTSSRSSNTGGQRHNRNDISDQDGMVV